MGISGRTMVCGIMGLPVTHSLSPAMHNAAFRSLGLDMVYVPFPVTDVAVAVAGFKASGIRGMSVTIPYKEKVIPCLDGIDPVAERIGAVNTLLFANGRVHGSNTDWQGAVRALRGAMPLAGTTVLLLGAGGSAKAIGFGLREEGAGVVLASRTEASGRALATLLDCPWIPLAEAGRQTADALVNATSVGMSPGDEDSPLADEDLHRFPVVMDIVYSPLRTRLLRAAEASGCRTVDGLAMLLHQGMAQFETWTGQPAPEHVMRQALLAGLGLSSPSLASPRLAGCCKEAS